jgi:hypothetical protein
MKTINKFYTKAFFALCGFLIVFWTLYVRFLRPRAIGEVNFTYSDIRFIIYLWLIVVFTIILISVLLIPSYLKYINKLAKKKDPTKSFFFAPQQKILCFLSNIHQFYDKSIETFYTPLYRKIERKFPNFCKNIAIRGSDFLQKSVIAKIIILSYLPPCIISVTYFIEVVILNKFTYFPLAVFLMIFPIGLRIFLYTASWHVKTLDIQLGEAIKLVETFTNGNESWTWADNSWVDQDARCEELLNELVSLKYENKDLVEFFDDFRNILNGLSLRIYFVAISSTFWLISFSYMLYKILNNITY